jgi:UDP-N-acetylglucosamine--dolichyl-phosphate N-acetylglucosaminephosphotransferase
MGLVCASIYIILLLIFIPFPFSETFFSRQANQGQTKHGLKVDDFPHHQVSGLVVKQSKH